MAITMRIGLEKDFIPERMSVGELAISTDTGLMRYCHGPNKIKLIATDEDIAEMRKMVSDFDLTVQQAFADIGNLGQSQTERVNTAGNTQTQRVNTAGDTQVSRVQAEGTTQVQNVQATASEIATDREQIHTNRDNVAQLQRNSAGAITRSAEGSFITLEDAADGMGFRQLEIPGMTEQRTTTGAQLFDAGTIIDDVITIHFTPMQLEANTEYTLSSETAKDYDGAGAYLFFASGEHTSGSFTTANDGVWKSNPRTVISDTNGYVTIIYKQKVNGYLKNGNIMLNKGATALPWEPYTGAAPSPSPGWSQELENVGVPNEAGKYKVKITACEKNLLDMTGAKGGTSAGITTVVNPDGTLTSNGTGTGGPVAIWLLGGYRPVTTDNVLMVLQAGKTYYISDVVLYMGTDRTAQNKLFVDPAKYPEGFKVTGVRHAQIDSGTVLTNKVYHPRVILGDTDTGWEPYRGHTAIITSDRPLTKWDKLTCRDGVFGCAYNGGITVYDGSNDETWTLQSINGNGIANFQITLNGAVSNFDSPNMCSHFPHQTEAIANVTKPGFLISNSTGKSILYIRIPSTTASTVEAFKAWLAEHIMTVQYQTDTETWVPLSHEEQAAMNALCTYAGTTHIWTDDPLQPVISLDYTVDTDGYIRDTVPAYRDVERFALTGEASGAMATCMDSAEWPLLGIGVQGKCEQVTTTGAQLFDVSTAKDGCYVSDSTGGEGCGTDGVGKFASDYIPVVPACNITFDKKTAWGAWYNAQKQFISGFVHGEPRTITAPENAAYMRFTGYLDSKNVMVNVGDTALPWEPYTGAAPSPSPAYKQEIQETGTYNPETGMYEADMVMTGAQLFDQTTVTKQSYVNDVTGKIGSTAEDVNASDYISVMGYEYIKITSTMKTKQWGAFYDTNKTFLSGIVGYDKPIPVPPDASYARLTVIGDNLKTFMVNAGATALPWEPYKGVQTLPLTADQPWRGIGDVHDEVCERDGVLGTLRCCAVLKPQKIISVSEGTNTIKYSATWGEYPKVKGGTKYPGLCNALKWEISQEDTPHFYWGDDSTGAVIYVPKGYTPNPEDFTFYGVLAAPVWKPFPEEVQRTYRKLKSYAGTTHAWVDDPLQPEVSFKYVKDSKLVLGKLEDRLAALESVQAQTAAAFSYLPPEIQAAMIETETRELMNSI